MPFGQIFAALYFGVLCTAAGVTLLGHPVGAGKAAGASIVILGLSLALALLLRRSWARAAALIGVVAMFVVALRRAATSDGVLDMLILFASLVAFLALLLPATGRTPQPRERATGARRGGLELLKLSAAAGFVGLLVSVWLATPFSTEASHSGGGVVPTSAIAKRVRWIDFGAGLELARAEDRPVLAVFVTDWCPYCTKMDRKTWRASSVVERLSDLVTVRVDAEETRERNGFKGAELAAQFGVTGFPALVVLDSAGRPIAQSSGYMPPRQLLAWLDDVLGRRPPGGPATAL